MYADRAESIEKEMESKLSKAKASLEDSTTRLVGRTANSAKVCPCVWSTSTSYPELACVNLAPLQVASCVKLAPLLVAFNIYRLRIFMCVACRRVVSEGALVHSVLFSAPPLIVIDRHSLSLCFRSAFFVNATKYPKLGYGVL